MAGILDQENPPEVDTSKNYYEDLVGEGKSFKDPEALAKGKYMADMHIKALEKRMDELRNDYLKEQADNQTRAKLEDLLKTLENKQPSSNNQSEPVSEKPTLDLDEIEKRMSQRFEQGINAYEQANRQKENTKVVVDRLKERYGASYQDTVKSQLQTMGMSEEMFNTMVKDAPQALLRTLGIEGSQRESYQAPPRSETQFQFRGAPKRTYAYYEELKKKNPRLYYNPKTLVQMERDALEQGESFADGSFNKSDRELLKERLGF